jgi:two-component system response regulator AtoC
VRELAHLIERAVLLSRDGRIGPRDLPMPGPDMTGVDGADPYAALDGMTVAGAERWLIARALERTGGNVSAAARALGLTRMAMRYRMDKYGL